VYILGSLFAKKGGWARRQPAESYGPRDPYNVGWVGPKATRNLEELKGIRGIWTYYPQLSVEQIVCYTSTRTCFPRPQTFVHTSWALYLTTLF